MAIKFGDSVANHVKQASVNCVATEWTPLSVESTPLKGRVNLRLFVRGNIGMTVALAYANVNSQGGFTTPTDSVAHATILRGGAISVEPCSDKVAVYGRLLLKAGATDNSVRVIVTEYR